jgi:hypothetical protein
MKLTERHGSALEDPFNVLPLGFGERPAGLTSVALRELHSSSVLKNADLQTHPAMPDRSPYDANGRYQQRTRYEPL